MTAGPTRAQQTGLLIVLGVLALLALARALAS
jgi:hypothetical protein